MNATVRKRPTHEIELAAGTGLATLGYVLLAALVYGRRTDPFGLSALTTILVLASSVAAFAAVVGWHASDALSGGGNVLARLVRAVVASGAGIGAAAGYVHVALAIDDNSPAAWLLILLPVAAAAVAVAADDAGVTRPGRAVVAVVAGGAGVVAWGVVTVMSIQLTWQPRPVRAGQESVHVAFEVEARGAYEVRLAGYRCGHGTLVAAGALVAPKHGERAAVELDIPATLLTPGRNDVRICVRDGIRSGEATLPVAVDVTAPTAPTLSVTPASPAGDELLAASRHLHLFGSADTGSEVEIRLDGDEFAHPPVRDGRWSHDWFFASDAPGATFDVIARDRAGNLAAAPSVTVRFDSAEPPAVTSAAYPGIAIECRGALAAIDPDACRDLGVEALAGMPQLVPGIARLVVTDDRERCAAIAIGSREWLVTYNRFECPA